MDDGRVAAALLLPLEERRDETLEARPPLRIKVGKGIGGEYANRPFDERSAPKAPAWLVKTLGIEYFGTIYNLSPFLSILFPSLAKRQLDRELDSRTSLGMILVAVAVKL